MVMLTKAARCRSICLLGTYLGGDGYDKGDSSRRIADRSHLGGMIGVGAGARLALKSPARGYRHRVRYAVGGMGSCHCRADHPCASLRWPCSLSAPARYRTLQLLLTIAACAATTVCWCFRPLSEHIRRGRYSAVHRRCIPFVSNGGSSMLSAWGACSLAF